MAPSQVIPVSQMLQELGHATAVGPDGKRMPTLS